MQLGLLLTSLTLGIRHGFDWDHIAAIADLSGTAETRRRGFVLSMLYALGHGVVVFALGSLAIAFGFAIPESLDAWMGRIVGITLIALGAWILIELLRKGRDFRLRSRWMLMISGTFSGIRKVRDAAAGRTIVVEHEHDHDHTSPAGASDHTTAHAHDHAHVELPADVPPAVVTAAISARVTADARHEPLVPAGSRWQAARQRLARGHSHGHSHSHSHRHQLALPTQADASYGNGTAAGIGVLHGVGVESPTQIAIFVATTASVGVGYGFILLGMWVVGLLVANAAIAALAGAGLLQAERSFPIYATLAVIVSVMSIALGTLYLLGLDVLPGLLV